MNFFIFIFLIVAGAAGTFFFYKRKLKSWNYFLSKFLDDLSDKDGIKSDNNNDTLPSEFSPFLEQLEYRIAYNKDNIGKDQTSEFSDETGLLKKTINNLHIVNELGRRVTSSLYLQQTFSHLYTTINSMMDAAVVELRVYNEATGSMHVFTNLGNNHEETHLETTNNMAEWCFKNNREVFLEDAEKNFARYVFQPLILSDGRIAKSVIIFPIINHDVVSGTISIISFQKNSFEDYHREIIRQLLGYIAVAIDNAMRHEELNLTKIRAEQSEKFKEQFLANMSHEIRTPINAVTGMTRLLLEKQPRPDQLRYLDSIRNASDSLLVIINDILDLSKIEAGKIEFEQIDFLVSDLINNVKEIMHFKIEEKGLSFSEDIDSHVPPILIGDPTRLTQILINLLGNAIKFTEKGSVSLKVIVDNIRNDSLIQKKDPSNSTFLRFEVSDTGIGMTKSQQSRLFQDYAQASTETARKYGGTGLGLSISKQLVQLQGGTIEVSSEPGKGSTFTFTLPFAISINKTVLVKENTVSKEMLLSLRGIRILLCDDNEYNRIVVKETLQLKIENLHIDEAFDGLQAIEMIKNNDYDVVLMDLVMPNLDGLEATRIIRNELPSPKNEIQIIALTASVVKSELEKSYAAGMNGFIPKPFKSDELLGAIYNSQNKNSIIDRTVAIPDKPTRKSSGLIDLNYLIEFTEGDEIRMQRHIDLFIEKTPLNIGSLISSLSVNDLEKIRITAHSMKPQLEITGVQNGLDIAEEIEQICNDKNNVNKLPELINKLKMICDQAVSELSELNEKNSK